MAISIRDQAKREMDAALERQEKNTDENLRQFEMNQKTFDAIKDLVEPAAAGETTELSDAIAGYYKGIPIVINESCRDGEVIPQTTETRRPI